MSCGLFSSFDPALISSGMSLKWVSIGVGFWVISWQVFSMSTGVELLKSSMVEWLGDLVKESSSDPKDSLFSVYSLMVLLMAMNLGGMIPYSLVCSSHLCVNLSLSIPLWVAGIMLFFWVKLDEFVSHFLPTGSPIVLWPFLVMVEFTSWLIRPFTLAIRLMANIMAGHLITNLLSEMISVQLMGVVAFPVHLGFVMYEVGVCMIQAYVFTSLIVLYSSEVEK